MNIETIYREVDGFCRQTHGSSDYHKDEFFVKGMAPNVFAPLSYLNKKVKDLNGLKGLFILGYVVESFDLVSMDEFPMWYEKQFARKFLRKVSRRITIVYMPNSEVIEKALETVNKGYETLRQHKILLNGKKLPVQIGEWFAKCIFGLNQVKSTSQRGFDFFLDDKRVEVKTHWGDQSSPKGVKIRKSLVDLSDYVILIYIAKNLKIREICFLDANFVGRKFSSKGHTLFLKDADIGPYFFSNSSKHFDKIVNKNALIRFSSSGLAMSLVERL